MSMSARLRSLMQQRGLNSTGLAQRSGLAVSSISRYLSERQEPGVSALVKLALALEVSVAVLAGSEHGASLTPKQQVLVQLEELVHALREEELSQTKESAVRALIPLYSGVPFVEEGGAVSAAGGVRGSGGANKASPAGDWKPAAPAQLGSIPAPSDLNDADAYAVRINDDLNAPRLVPGDIAMLSPASSWKSGDFCTVFRGDGSGILGRTAKRKGQLVVKRINSPEPPEVFSVDTVRAVHKLVWIKSV
ncbi:MAG: helix-turn-helix domain-containing protein [Candidatus Eisenbacteria bacterium]